MDIQIQQNKKSYKKQVIGLLLTLAVSAASYWALSQPAAATKVDSGQLWLGNTEQGTLKLEVTGFGLLESKVQRFLTAPYSAVVEEIVLKPGARVTPDSVILRMSNPEIGQAVVQAELALNAENARLKQLKLLQTREKLVAENEVAELALDLGVFNSKLTAEAKLAKDGIVSKFILMQTQAEVNKLSGRLDNAKKRLVQLADLHIQAYQVQLEQINEKRSLLKLANDQLQRLEVRAGIDGVLQQLPVELGQSVSNGTQLALVGGTEDLIAVVQIPQRDIQGMLEGMTATIDTRGGVARGKVKRIDPVVREGNVEVEIALTGPLPENARPSLNVEAKILLGMLENVLYIEAPVNSVEQGRLQLFKVDLQGNTAQQTWLEFGAKSGQFIEIKSGADINQRFILSDMRKFAQQPTITLINQ